MATRRMVPTSFFRDPDILNLQDHDTRLILLGLILFADDEGREIAHARLLSREWEYSPEQIEAALQDLAANDLILLYQVGKHRYYSLTRWANWQTINPNRMIRSKYPAPPVAEMGERLASSSEQPDVSREMQENTGEILGSAGGVQENTGETPTFPGISRPNVIESNVIESKGVEEEHANTHPSNVVPFPIPHSSDDIDGDAQRAEATHQVAQILHLPVTPALTRVVREFAADPNLSLLSEADAAHEYIQDSRRNRKRQAMSPAFFRRWLRRERGDYAPTPSELAASPVPSAAAPAAPHRPRTSLMDLEEQYRREMEQGPPTAAPTTHRREHTR